ncbi:Phylloquinone omega-hydroxylase [Actinidia chinensis var. chinensis]|uniref:Phylloquinone omega-hydroxylase n=1 Tax=Actinidia chinensis var. chinensis TaxID=1590841 RepID=A0A2R6PTN6_ACTCC|nr:Phylloquinone omega-hydroxylase [Actinidia chinensis var. chinensis]
MLHKLFGARKTKPNPSSALVLVEEGSAALRIVHMGGQVESYYMAVPASRVMEKYPSFVLARPDIFRRPWEAVVRSEAILVPGQKFFVVPRRTITKLRRRIRKPYKVLLVHLTHDH